MRALCVYAVTLTRTPAEVTEADLAPLRHAGFDDRAIVDANQVASYFNYVNRIADGLGVELEPIWPADVRERRAYALGRALTDVPSVNESDLPWLSVDEMRDVDRLAIEVCGVTLDRMMENAGRHIAPLAIRLLGGGAGRRIIVLAGGGSNGGGGMVAARHLAVAGARVVVRLARPADELPEVPRAQHAILGRMGVAVSTGLEDPDVGPDLVVDAVLGYGQTGAPSGQARALIEWARGRRVLSLDVPSGLELRTGTLCEPHVRAEATLSLALPKKGLRGGAEAVGDLFLGDVSVPPIVYETLGIPHHSPFGAGPIVRLIRSERRTTLARRTAP